jgi:16S rRNA (cytosine967-C5)-methyltransferase
LDADAKRLTRVSENLDRLGLRADLLCADAAQPQTWWDGEQFDRILADVPCSASGVVRRHPDIKWLRRETDLATLTQQQASLLEALWNTLRPGGKLLYVTCSVFKQENTDLVNNFLSRYVDAKNVTPKDFPATLGQLLPTATQDGFYYALLSKTI